MRTFFLTLILTLPAWHSSVADTASPPEQAFMRGMTVSCPIWGQIWGSNAMVESLEELRGLGVRWVAIHPYAVIRRDGSVRFRPAAETGYLPRAAAFPFLLSTIIGMLQVWLSPAPIFDTITRADDPDVVNLLMP